VLTDEKCFRYTALCNVSFCREGLNILHVLLSGEILTHCVT
jgi:hypothetical protein